MSSSNASERLASNGQGDAEPSGPLTVETAAIRIGDAVFTLPRPNRHHNVMWWLHVLGITSGQMHDQGFVLSNGQFADRHVASVVAQEAGQAWDMTVPGTLFSEDLWDGGADLPSMETIKALSASAPLRSGGQLGPGMPPKTFGEPL